MKKQKLVAKIIAVFVIIMVACFILVAFTSCKSYRSIKVDQTNEELKEWRAEHFDEK